MRPRPHVAPKNASTTARWERFHRRVKFRSNASDALETCLLTSDFEGFNSIPEPSFGVGTPIAAVKFEED